MKEKYIPKYCIVTGNLHTREWSKNLFDKNIDAKPEINLQIPINIKSIDFSGIKIEADGTYV